MLKSKRPKSKISLVRPHDDGMKQHCMSPASDCLNGMLGNTVLVMSSSARKCNNLTVHFEIATKLGRVERNIVGVTLL
jgi:hypothetical protein